ncbi:MAG: DUF3592 domain-containing protein [Bacteroidota bacterium]
MAFSEETTNKIKVLLYEDKQDEAVAVLVTEAGLSPDEAVTYVTRLKESLGSEKKQEGSKSKKLLPYIFFTLSLVLWGIAVWLFVNKNEQIENSELTTAVVVKFIVSDGGGFAPILEYEINGELHRYTSTLYSNPPAYELKETIEIYVNKDDPNDVMINSFVSKWLVILILVFFGIVLDIVGVVALKYVRTETSGVSLLDEDDGFSRSFDD